MTLEEQVVIDAAIAAVDHTGTYKALHDAVTALKASRRKTREQVLRGALETAEIAWNQLSSSHITQPRQDMVVNMQEQALKDWEAGL